MASNRAKTAVRASQRQKIKNLLGLLYEGSYVSGYLWFYRQRLGECVQGGVLMDKVDKAIERLKLGSDMSLRYYGKPLMITYSGGKDSEVLADLAIKAKIPIEIVNSHTTADAPPTVYHIRNQFKKWENDGIDCKIVYPKCNEREDNCAYVDGQDGRSGGVYGRRERELLQQTVHCGKAHCQ
jgi:hypothetical protein